MEWGGEGRAGFFAKGKQVASATFSGVTSQSPSSDFPRSRLHQLQYLLWDGTSEAFKDADIFKHNGNQ